jgi:hypothetical protein
MILNTQPHEQAHLTHLLPFMTKSATAWEDDSTLTFTCFASVYCTLNSLHFLQYEGLWPPYCEQVYKLLFFPTASAHFLSVGRTLVIL